ncbi:MAG TPA: cupin domain-containing protein [Flavipsychrobacter sp.]
MTDNPISISKLIAPLSFSDFFENYWEKNYIHIQKEGNSYDHIIDTNALDAFLSMQNLKPEGVRLARDGYQIPETEWTKTTTILNGIQNVIVDPDKVLHHYYEGATIIISFAELMIPALANVNSAIEQELGIKSQANVYITPPNAQGFTQHYDTHDIILLQIKGPKTWNLYDTGEELPTSTGPFTNEPTLIETITINTGDILYLPRGVVHEAFSSETSTIHINFSLKPRYGFHLIEAIAELAQKEDVFFRKVVPHKFSSNKQRADYMSAFNEKLQELLAKHPVEELIKKQEENFIERQNLDFNGRLTDAIEYDQISAETTVCRRTGFTYNVEASAHSTTISFGKKKIVLPKFVDNGLFLQDAPFKVKEIKGLLTEDNKISMVQSLVRTGYLMIMR